ncbi:flagellar protein FliS [bacterium]|nr:flagellar protein FliS [bacterium]
MLVELMGALNWGGRRRHRQGTVRRLRLRMYHRLVEANIKGRADMIAECEKLLSELLDGWERALAGAVEEKDAAEAAPAAAPALAGVNLCG